jgi:hypothetical protein
MPDDEIVAEIRKFREEYAKRFNYDLRAMFEDLRKQQRASGSKVVSLSPKRITARSKRKTAMTASLEKRVAELEARLDAVQKRLAALDDKKPWWERIAGSFRNDPIYEEAMRLGREYRESQRPKPRKRRKKRSS